MSSFSDPQRPEISSAPYYHRLSGADSSIRWRYTVDYLLISCASGPGRPRAMTDIYFGGFVPEDATSGFEAKLSNIYLTSRTHRVEA